MILLDILGVNHNVHANSKHRDMKHLIVNVNMS